MLNLATSQSFDDEETFVVNHQTLEVGMTLACYLPRYIDEEPQIGKVVSIESNDESHIEVDWMTGTYSEPWVVCKRSAGRTCTMWREKIPLNSILFPIELTTTCRISRALKKKLLKAYEKKRTY